MNLCIHSRYELALRSEREYGNPILDVKVKVVFRCGDLVVASEAFWDGGQTWRARFAPSVAGVWAWETACSVESDAGLHLARGSFECFQPEDSSALMHPGRLRVAANGTHLTDADGAPFFWMADTAWNGPLKAGEDEWATYLAKRKAQGFRVIQVVTTQWLGASGDAEGRPAYLGREAIRIEPAFFKRLDRRMDAIAEAGLVAAPVLGWAATWNADAARLNPAIDLPEEQLFVLLNYIFQRYRAHPAVWILAGDATYTGEEAERWRRLGRGVFEGADVLATVHPAGRLWVEEEFDGEAWFSLHGYQSGPWKDEANARWIQAGPPQSERGVKVRPQINLEPAYEGHIGLDSGGVVTALDVRRASYWSLLAAPTAGISYGAHGVWSWEHFPALPLSHPHAGVAPTWHEGLEMPGGESMRVLRGIFESVEWWRLRPFPGLLRRQPGEASGLLFVSAARSDEGDVAVVYAPAGGVLDLDIRSLQTGLTADCLDAATGERLWQRPLAELDGPTDLSGHYDRVLVFARRRGAERD